VPGTVFAGERISLRPSGPASQLGGVALLDTRELVFEQCHSSVTTRGRSVESTANTAARRHTGKDSGPSGSSTAPFWRKQGLNGFVLRLDDEFHVVLDNSPPESSCGVLVGLLEAGHARTAAEMAGDERRKLITSTLVNYFGAQAAEQFDIVEQGLNGRGVHPLLRGHVGTGVWTRYGKARCAGRARSLGWLGKDRRVGRLHGAIGSGRRAAGILVNTQLSTPGAGQRTTASAAALSITTRQPLAA
jgi:hypothetical protein